MKKLMMRIAELFIDLFILYIKFCAAIFVICLILMLGQVVFADENGSWFCEQESAKRVGNIYWSCGVGDDENEGIARKNALDAAMREFRTVCDASTDCKDLPRTIDPQRTSCNRVKAYITYIGMGEVWRCTRLIMTTVEK